MTTRPVVCVTSIVPGLSVVVRQLLPAVEVLDAAPDRDGKAQIPVNTEVLFGDTPSIISFINEGQGSLKWAQSTWAGVESLFEAFPKQPEGITITRMGDGFGRLMAEYVVGHVLARELSILNLHQQQQQKLWEKSSVKDRRMLTSLTIGVLGAGSISTESSFVTRSTFSTNNVALLHCDVIVTASVSEDTDTESENHSVVIRKTGSHAVKSTVSTNDTLMVAQLCKAVGMTVWGLSRSKKENSTFDCLVTLPDLTSFLEGCDYICNVLPSTSETKDMFSGDVLKCCKSKSPVFINVGRGSIINEDSLFCALENGWLRGAVLDVFNAEPLPPESRLWSHPAVTVTPHVSGPSLAENIAKVFVSNYEKYTQRKTLDYVVDWGKGY